MPVSVADRQFRHTWFKAVIASAAKQSRPVWSGSRRRLLRRPASSSQCWVDGPLTASEVPSWGRSQRPATETVPMKRITIGLDIAKSVFQVHGEDPSGQIVVQK